MDVILEDIHRNEDIAKKIQELEHEIERIKPNDENDGEKKVNNDVEKLLKEISNQRRNIKNIQLPNQFIPNTYDHLRSWNKLDERDDVFVSSIEDETIRKIMMLEVDTKWKILLMMGIGVFIENKCRDYNAIMFELASTQKLFLIIASSDYIYGTNYQFSHGYIGKDLNLTQEKIIQALGRIGRAGSNESYSIRLRSDEFARKLFEEEDNKREVINMNVLFA